MTSTRSIELSVNGKVVSSLVEPRRSLADFLRLDLGLTGTHLGCEHGVCGACTVQVDDIAVRGCLMLAVQAHGRSVRTVEGLATGNELHPLQQAFRECHALQCGFCTAGVLMTMEEFLREQPSPSEEEIREALTGNICRCTGYQGIVDAVLFAARQLQTAREGA
jgi:aerobic-type carbon monoxide dehydrogenase small subunit (CoxS/CutS family)